MVKGFKSVITGIVRSKKNDIRFVLFVEIDSFLSIYSLNYI